MVFPVVGGNESKVYEISNSLRLDSASTANLTRTPSSAGNRRTYTLSTWIKRGKLDATEDHIISAGASNDDSIFFNSSHQFRFIWDISSGTEKQLVSNRVFRDPSAWYHLVVIVDTTQSTASNRIKLYVNGIQETSFGTDNRSDLTQNYDMNFNNTVAHRIGDRNEFASNANNSFDGYLSEFHWVDGTAKAHTDFGKFDSNGVWIPKKYSGSYGTNGFYLQFKQTGTSANASGIGADTSGNTHHWTPNNLAAIDVTEDTCTNNFATLNPLKTTSTNANLSEGNTKFSVTANGTSQNRNTFPTISFPTSGKWYMEVKATHSNLASDSGNQIYIGIMENPQNVDHRSTANANSISTNGTIINLRIVATLSDAIAYGTNGSATSYNTDPDWSSGDIIGIALDMDNGRIYYHLNGTYYDDASGNVPNPATPANHNHSFTVPSNGMTFFMSILRYNTSTVEMEVNFGNPSYSISSGNNDGDYGNFEYAPPSGYYALCTKRLAEFG
jgi:hypothetical protein